MGLSNLSDNIVTTRTCKNRTHDRCTMDLMIKKFNNILLIWSFQLFYRMPRR